MEEYRLMASTNHFMFEHVVSNTWLYKGKQDFGATNRYTEVNIANKQQQGFGNSTGYVAHCFRNLLLQLQHPVTNIQETLTHNSKPNEQQSLTSRQQSSYA